MELYFIKRITVFAGLLSALFTCFSALDGLFEARSYHQLPLEVSNLLKGHDLVSLLIIVPVLLLTILLSRRGFRRAYIVMLSSLLYLTLFYVLEFLIFFHTEIRILPIFIVLFAGSGFVNALWSLDVHRLSEELSSQFPHRFFGVFLFVSGVVVLLFWLQVFIFSPMTGERQLLLFGLSFETLFLVSLPDLFIFFPLSLVSGLYLWRNLPWGYPLAAFCFTKFCYSTLSFFFVTLFNFYYSVPVDWVVQAFFFLFLIINGIVYRHYLRVVEDI